MSFQNARYCNGFPILRGNSDTLGVSIHSILSDVFSLFPYVPVTKMVTVVTRKEAQILTERWRTHYNTVRPHSSLGDQPPTTETTQLAS